MAEFSDYDEFLAGAAPAAPSAPLRRKPPKQRRLSALAGWANTPLPQGQMVSGHFVRANPVESFTSAVMRGLGIAGTIQAGKDERDMSAFTAEGAAEAAEQKARQAEAAAEDRRLGRELQGARLGLDVESLARQRERDAADAERHAATLGFQRERTAGEQARFEQEQARHERDRAARDAAESTQQTYRERDLALRERQNEGLMGHRETLEELRRLDQQLREREIATRGRGAGAALRRPRLLPKSAAPKRPPDVADLLKEVGE